MAKLKWLEEYSGEPTEELIALEGKYRSDSIVLAFEQALDQKFARLGAESLSKEENVIMAIEALEREVNNGGYHQFFLNTGEYAPIVVDALKCIGCAETAKLTQEAIGALGIEGELTASAIERIIHEDTNGHLISKLGKYDGAYYEKAGDLSEPLLEFIKANRHRIHLTR
jgi:hypothetical protein